MKRLVGCIVAAMVMVFAVGSAEAALKAIYAIEIPTSGVSDPGADYELTGVSGFSGSSEFQVQGVSDTEPSGVTLFNAQDDRGSYYVLDMVNLLPLSGVTPDMSGTTFTIRMTERWGGGAGTERERAVRLYEDFTSGDSPWPIAFRSWAPELYFTLESSATAFEGPAFLLHVYSDVAGAPESLVVWPEQHTEVAASGVSNDFTSGGTGFYLPEGAEWFRFEANGGDVRFSTDGTDAESTGREFTDTVPRTLSREEIVEFGIGPATGAAGLTMTPYSYKP